MSGNDTSQNFLPHATCIFSSSSALSHIQFVYCQPYKPLSHATTVALLSSHQSGGHRPRYNAFAKVKYLDACGYAVGTAHMHESIPYDYLPHV